MKRYDYANAGVYTPREVCKTDMVDQPLADAIRLLGRIGFEQALWELLQATASQDNLAIVAYRQAGPSVILHTQASSTQVFAELRSTYIAGAYLLDPYFDLHLRHAPAGLYRLRDVAPDAFQRSRYYLEYYEQTTLLDELAFIAYPAPGVSLNICLGRDQTSDKPFVLRQIQACQRLAPLVIALAERHWADLRPHPGPADDTVGRLQRAVLSTHQISLSRRQAEVALLILKGHSTPSIALRLGVAPQTVKVFRKQLYVRCTISSQAELFGLMLPLLGGAMP